MSNPSKISMLCKAPLCCLIFGLVAAGSSFLSARPESLSAADREKLLEKLEKIGETADGTSKQRFTMALRAFQQAISSDDKAHDLFLQCTEKVRFEDEKLKSQAFREWKRKHKEKEDSPGFRRALRHQLNWLLLTIEASVKPDDIQELGVRAMGKVDQVFSDHELLEGHEDILKKNVLGSVFAKAYNINGLEAKDWPLFPLDLENIYEKIAMPPLRNPNEVDRLRGAWMKRIEHESLILLKWGKLPKDASVGMKKEMVPPAFEKWKDDGYLKLLWRKEIDCFAVGDEKTAALNMLAHLEKHIHHKLSLEWIGEFKELMTVAEPEEGAEVASPTP